MRHQTRRSTERDVGFNMSPFWIKVGLFVKLTDVSSPVVYYASYQEDSL